MEHKTSKISETADTTTENEDFNESEGWVSNAYLVELQNKSIIFDEYERLTGISITEEILALSKLSPLDSYTLEDKYQKAIKYLQENQPNCDLGLEFLELAEYSSSQMKEFQQKVIEMAQIQNVIFQLNTGKGSRCHLRFDVTLSMHLCSDEEVHLID